MKRFRRTLSVVLSAAMILQMGVTPAMAQMPADISKTIISFATLAEEEQNITLPLDSTEAEVLAKLPEKLTATVETTTYVDSGTPPIDEVIPPVDEVIPPVDEGIPPADEVIPPVDEVTPPADEIASDSDADATGMVQAFSTGGTVPIGLSSVETVTTDTEKVSVTWALAEGEAFASDAAGELIYLAKLSDPRYTLAADVSLPEIRVIVKANVSLATVTAFDPLVEAVMYQSVPAKTLLSALNLPKTLAAAGYTVEATTPAAITIAGITWQPDAPYDEAADTGAYTFTAVLPEGYALAKGVSLPELYVMVGAEVMPFASNPVALTFDVMDGQILITDGTAPNTLKVSYGASTPVDNIPRDKAITITGSIGSNTQYSTGRIKVTCSGTANVTLKDATVYASTPFYIGAETAVNLTLEGTSHLQSPGAGAGIYVPKGAAITIDGDGTLTTLGNYGGAGIGGGAYGLYAGNPDAGTITINGGTVNAEGRCGGAGMGAGYNAGTDSGGKYKVGTAGTIIINDGTVNAKSNRSMTDYYSRGLYLGLCGAAIGGCFDGSGGVVKINGGKVTAIAAPKSSCAGIGAAYSGETGKSLSCGTIDITGGSVSAKGGDRDSAAIGNGGKGPNAGEPDASGIIRIKPEAVIELGGGKIDPAPSGIAGTRVAMDIDIYDARIESGAATYIIQIGSAKLGSIESSTTTAYEAHLRFDGYLSLTGEQEIVITNENTGASWTTNAAVSERQLTFGTKLRTATLWFYDDSIIKNIDSVTVTAKQDGTALNTSDSSKLVNLIVPTSITYVSSGVGKMDIILSENRGTTDISVTAAGLNGGTPMVKTNQAIGSSNTSIIMLGSFRDVLDLANGNITVEGDSSALKISYYTSTGNLETKSNLNLAQNYRIIQSNAGRPTTNRVIIKNTGESTAHLTLSGINVATSDRFAHGIVFDNAKAELWLEGENGITTSGDIASAISVPGGSECTLTGSGSLKASTASGSYAAAIGGDHDSKTTGKIIINDGTINVTSNGFGAAIGSANNNTTSGEIVINGGTVDATTQGGGAAIGNGASATATPQIRITGGTLRVASTAGGVGAGVLFGGGINGGINGGTVTITGGSVWTYMNSKISQQPPAKLTSDGITPVYLATVDLSEQFGKNAAVTSASLTGYGFDAVKTDSEGKIYLYLPGSADGTKTTAEFDGKTFIGKIYLNNDNMLIWHTLFTAALSGSPTETNAVISVTAEEDAQVYYAMLPTPPADAAALIGAAGSNSIQVTQGITEDILLSGLTPSLKYTYYLAAKAGTRYSEVETVSFTMAIPSALTFIKDAGFDIPAAYGGSAMAEIDVSGGAVGGTAPYSFGKLSGPDWLKVSTAGVLSGTRPDPAESTMIPASEAEIQVTDDAGATTSITIAVGAISPSLKDFVELKRADGATSNHNSLQEAVTAIGSEDGCTLKLLLNNDLVTAGVTIPDRSVTLDLNGKTLRTNSAASLINYSGTTEKTLTITDTVGTGKLQNTGSGAAIEKTSTGRIHIKDIRVISTGSSTIYFGNERSGSAEGLVIENSIVENSGASGSVVLNSSLNSITISGSTLVQHQGGMACSNPSSTATVTNSILWGGHLASSLDTNYGWSVVGDATLPIDVTLASGKSFNVQKASTLTIGAGVTVNNQGTINVYGKLQSGTPNGEITGSGRVVKLEDAKSSTITLLRDGKVVDKAVPTEKNILRITVEKPKFSFFALFEEQDQAKFYQTASGGGQRHPIGTATFKPHPEDDNLLIAELEWALAPHQGATEHEIFVEYGKLTSEDNLVNPGTQTKKIWVHGVAEVDVDGVKTEYKTLTEAVEKVQDGCTLKLLTSWDFDTTITFTNTLTLDLNGKKLTSLVNPAVDFAGGAGKTLTITDTSTTNGGTLLGSSNAAIHTTGGGALTLSGGTVSGRQSAIVNKSTGVITVLEKATVSSNSGLAIDLMAVGSSIDNRLVIEGGRVESKETKAAIQNNSTGGISISSGVVINTAGNTAIQSGDGTVTFTGGIIWGDVVNSAKVPLGMGWSVTGDQTLPVDATVPAGKTLTIPKDAALTIAKGVTVTNKGTIARAGALIYGAPDYGIIKGNPVEQWKDAASATISLHDKDGNDVAKAEVGKEYLLRVTVEKPKFSLFASFEAKDKANFYLGVNSSGPRINRDPVELNTVEGKLVAEVLWTPTADMMAAERNIFVEYGKLTVGDGNFIASGTATGKVAVYSMVEATINGVTKDYASIADALADIGSTDNCTIKLRSDFSLGTTITVKTTLTLDLNGKELLSSANPAVDFAGVVGKTLTITDTSTTDGVKSYNGKLHGEFETIKNTGGGTIIVLDNATISSRASNAILLDDVDDETDDRLVIKGGRVETASDVAAIMNYSQCGVNISGGVVENTGTRTAIHNISTGAITISGGTVRGSAANVAIENIGAGVITISGGVVEGIGNRLAIYAPRGKTNIFGGAVVSNAGETAIQSGDDLLTFTNGIIWGDVVNSVAAPLGIGWSVKGNQTLPVDATVPDGKTLTIPEDATLTIAKGVTVTNSGTINAYGTLNYGTLDYGTIGGDGTIYTASTATLTVENNDGGTITTAAYGDTVTLKVTAEKKTTTKTRAVSQDKAIFYLGTDNTGKELGEANVTYADGKAIATLRVTLQDATDIDWKIAPNSLFVDFGGSSGGLFGSTATGSLTITKNTEVPAPTHVAMDDSGTTKSFTFGTASGYDTVTDYEWKLGTDATWANVTENPIQFGNRAGNMQIRVKESAKYEAGASYTHETPFTATLEGSVAISGTAAYGETLTANATGTQSGAVLSYKWLADTEVLQTGISDTLAIPGAAVGKAITVEVTATGYSGKLTSTATVNVTKKSVPASAGTISKAYDGNNTVEKADRTLTITKVNAADDITISATNATYNDKTVDTGKAIALGTLTMTGTAADWYEVTAPSGVTGAITPQTVTVTAEVAEKVYDGNTTATAAYTVTGKITGESVTASGTATFADANAGSGKIVYITGISIEGADSGNYTLSSTTATAQGTITPAAETVTIDAITAVDYTGSQIKPTATVKTAAGTTLATTDYTMEYGANVNAGTDAGTVTVKAAAGGNYTFADVTANFTISKAAGSAISDTVTGSYTGNGTDFTYTVVPISGAEYKMDSGAWQESNRFTGIAPLSKHTFTARMKETDNYKAGTAKSGSAVTFVKLSGVAAPTLAYTVGGETGSKTITITTVDNAEYQFGSDPWGNTNTKTHTTDETVTIGIRMKETATHEAGTAATASVNLAKQEQSAPAAFALTYVANGETDYTVTIPTVAGCEYSFDGTTYSSTNTKTANVGDIVTGYLRKAETTTHNASPAVRASVTLPMFTVQQVTAAPSGGRFFGSVSVTLASGTAGAEIYYTTDGSAPSTGSIKYAAAFTLTSDTTVKAIAVKTGMTDSDVASFAFLKNSSSAGGGGGGGGSSSVCNPAVNPADTKPNPPTTMEISVDGNTDPNGNTTASAADHIITNAIDQAQQEAKKNGTDANGIAIILDVKMDQTAAFLEFLLSEASINALTNANVVRLTIRNNLSTVTLDLAALQSLAGGEVRLSIGRADVKTLSAEAQTVIGNHPAFRYSVTVGGKAITDFKGGRVSLKIPYFLTGNEQAGQLIGVYVDDSGKAAWHNNSGFDPISGTMLVSTNHFSVYAIGSKETTVKFTDIDNHWAKNDIDFVTARDLLGGTGTTTFSPDAGMTRGMFVTALGRLAGVDITKWENTNTKFTDVKADAYYAPYVAWASANGIVNGTVNGTGTTTFCPDTSITREQMAVILVNYSKAMGFQFPRVHTQVIFTDHASISARAKDAVRQMQMAGILIGKSGNRFDPTATATRAEASAMLHRYVELTARTETPDGWAVNESGQWLYFENTRRSIGRKIIDGKVYIFDRNGIWVM